MKQRNPTGVIMKKFLSLLILNVLLISAPAFAATSAVDRKGAAYPIERLQKKKDFYLKIPSPTDLSDTATSDQEVWSMTEFNGDLYISYFTALGTQSAKIYKWDGGNLTHFYTLGTGAKFQQVAMEAFNGKLYAGIGGSTAGDGDIWEYDPLATPTYSLFFNVSNSTVTVPNDSSNNAIYGATAFSIEFLATPLSAGESNAGRVVDKTDSGTPTKGYRVWFDSSSRVNFAVHADGSNKTTTTSTTVTFGNQVHIAVTWASGAAPKIYIDGTEAAYTTSTAATTPTDDTASSVSIGNRAAATDRTFDGEINRLRIYRGHELTSGEVTTLYGSGTVSGSTAEYLMSEGSGSTLADSSAAGNDGTLSATTSWRSTAWTKVHEDVSDHNAVFAFGRYNGKLYAGFAYSASDGDVYETSDGTTWTISYTAAADEVLIEDIRAYNGRLYVAGGGAAGAAFLKEFDGTTWTEVYDGSATTYLQVVRVAGYQGKLYMATYGTTDQGDVYEYQGGATWTKVFDEAGYDRAHGLMNYNDRLYVGLTGNTKALTDGDVWVWDGQNGTSGWEKVADSVSEKEAFIIYAFGGELLVGYGYNNGDATVYSLSENQSDIISKRDSRGLYALYQDDTNPNYLGGQLTVNYPGSIGWSKQSAANQACNTTCTSACVFGQNTADMSIVDCDDATADVCKCAGAS